MTLAYSLITFEPENEENQKTCSRLKSLVGRYAWSILQKVEGYMYPGYDSNSMDPENGGVIVLVRVSDGLDLDRFYHYSYCSEWRAIVEICNKYFKRGSRSEDYKILFMPYSKYRCANIVHIKGRPHRVFYECKEDL